MAATIKMTLAARVAQARGFIGVNQAELARRIGVKAQTIQSIESGRSKKTRYALEIANECRVDPHWLATGYGEPRPAGSLLAEQTLQRYETLTSAALEIAAAWSALPPYRREALRAQIFLEAAIASTFPRLSESSPIPPETFAQYAARFAREIVKHLDQKQDQ